MTPLPFHEINEAAFRQGRTVVERLIPGGKFRSLEYVVRNPRRGDDRPGSFKINYRTGKWADFATTDKGGDFISLVAYLESTDQSTAARALADIIGFPLPKMNGHANGGGHVGAPQRPVKIDSRPAGVEIPAPALPPRTQPGADGKLKFIAGDDAPSIGPDELRRHSYRRDGMPVRIKIKFKTGRFANWYRVSGGWQSAKPAEYIDVPYLGAINSFDPEIADELVFWSEGERDTDTVALLHLPAFSFGGVGDGLPASASGYIAGRNVVILADNDDPGRSHAQAKAKMAHGVACSVRVMELPGLPLKGDVTDWVAQGHTAEELIAMVKATPLWEPSAPAQPDDPSVVTIEDRIETAAEINRLAKLPLIEFERERSAAAKRLGIRAAALDIEVKAARGGDSEAKGQGRSFQIPEIETWPDPVDGATLLSEVATTIARYVVMPGGGAEIVALWAVHTHCFDCFMHSPRLAVTSPFSGLLCNKLG